MATLRLISANGIGSFGDIFLLLHPSIVTFLAPLSFLVWLLAATILFCLLDGILGATIPLVMNGVIHWLIIFGLQFQYRYSIHLAFAIVYSSSGYLSPSYLKYRLVQLIVGV